jgi:hypothetical protein
MPSFSFDPIEPIRELSDLALGVGRRETKRIKPHDDRGVRRDRRSMTLRIPRVGERTNAGRERFIDPIAEVDKKRALAERADPDVAQDRNAATFTLALANASRTA